MFIYQRVIFSILCYITIIFPAAQGKMTFLWAAPGGAGTPPPASVEHVPAPAVAPAPVAPAGPEAPVAMGNEGSFGMGKHRKMVDFYGFMRNLWGIHGDSRRFTEIYEEVLRGNSWEISRR